MSLRRLWRRHLALPAEHGAWIWWLGPLIIGTVAGGQLRPELLVLALAALATFLLRQPATLAVKTLSGRRSRQDLPAALAWAGIYTVLAVGSAGVLIALGQRRLLLLAVPALLIFSWHLWLVSRRRERRQLGVEIFAAGALSLSAPAAYWVAQGDSPRTAWLLWLLTWFQSAASIVHVYARLNQRNLTSPVSFRRKLALGQRSLLYNGFNLLGSLVLAGAGWVPALVPSAYALMAIDALEGVLRPAVGARPTRIGLRQLLVGMGYVLLMLLSYALA